MKKISDYIALGRRIEKEVKENKLNINTSVNIALLSSNTTTYMKEVVIAQCYSDGILANVYQSDYGQYSQDLYNSASALYSSNPELIFISIDIQSISDDYLLIPYNKNEKERLLFSKEISNLLYDFAEQACKHSSAKIVLHNFEVPNYSPLGIIENKNTYGYIESIEEANRFLTNKCKDSNQIFVYDYNAFCSKYGKANIHDSKMYYMGDVILKPKFMPDLCLEYMRYINTKVLQVKKCIILDLDNTLWGGVIGEVGVESIHLGPTPEGRSFMEFQQCLLSLYKRGVILAINSKNNFDDAMLAIREHPHMILKEEHFAAIRINWDDKVSNIKSLAKELNIGLMSLVFIDDDQLNRDMVNKLLPEVLVIDMPRDPSLYVDQLKQINCFDTFVLTSEDRLKGQMYYEQKQREHLKRDVTDIKSYLRMLNISVIIRHASNQDVPRISQLTQKTNQFTLTSKRYSEENIFSLIKNSIFHVLVITVKDKFGDNGLTGVAIVKKNKKKSVWRIETFLISCRIIGREAENVLLSYIIKQAKKENVKFVIGVFIKTQKNDPAKNFYEKNGFLRLGRHNNVAIWKYNTNKDFTNVDFIKTNIE
jgi:FkbH-like protein